MPQPEFFVRHMEPCQKNEAIGMGPLAWLRAACVLKAILCNWLVSLATLCGQTSTSTLGKVAALWLPVFMFFAQGFEHVPTPPPPSPSNPPPRTQEGIQPARPVLKQQFFPSNK